jgi:hypothetical protein
MKLAIALLRFSVLPAMHMRAVPKSGPIHHRRTMCSKASAISLQALVRALNNARRPRRQPTEPCCRRAHQRKQLARLHSILTSSE